MKTLTHLTLLILLVVTSATSQSSNNASSTTAIATITTTKITSAPPAATTKPATVTSTSTNGTTSVTSTPINISSPVTNSSVASTKYESTTVTNTSTAVTTTIISSADVSSIKPQSTIELSSITVTKGTVPSVTSGSVTSSNTSKPNPDATGPCQEDSCSGGSSCVSLNNTYFCLCTDGYYYNSSKCNKGKIFPGKIAVSVNNSDISGLENKASLPYEKLHMKVTKFFEDVFINFTYGQTVIHNVRISPSARSEMRADAKGVDVTVVNIFPENTKEDENTVSSAILTAIQGNSGDITGYIMQDRCDFYGCEKTNAQDNCSSGLLCKCKQGLARPNPQMPLCLAVSPKCRDTCNEEHNMQCLAKNSGSLDCVCLPGYQEDDQGICQACAFGYSGVDCKDQFQLILTIVGTIAGILILGMVIALVVVRSKKKKKNLEEQNLIEKDFQNLQLQYTTGFSNPGAEGNIFPKVRANTSRDNQLQNPYINQRGVPRPDY